MKHPDLRLCASILGTLVWVAAAFPVAQQKTLFSFHSNAWLNLHQFVRLVARGGPPPTELSQLSDQERTQWAAGVEFYAPYAKRDLLFDQGMVDIGTALRRADGKANLDGIMLDTLFEMLERLMPIYQKHWWPAHDRANREWITAIQPLIDRHGAAIGQGLTRTYGVTWPNPGVSSQRVASTTPSTRGPGFTTTCAAPAAGTRSPSTEPRISTASARSPTRSPRSSPRSSRGGSSDPPSRPPALE